MMRNNDLIGRVLGTCTLLQLIGQGGMGAVYLAQQSRPIRRVAVKVLLPHVAVSSAEYREFRARAHWWEPTRHASKAWCAFTE